MGKLTIEERLNNILNNKNNNKNNNRNKNNNLNVIKNKKINTKNKTKTKKSRKIFSNLKKLENNKISLSDDDNKNDIDDEVENNIKVEKIITDKIENTITDKVEDTEYLIGGNKIFSNRNTNIIVLSIFLLASFVYIQFDKIKEIYRKSFSLSTSDFSR